ncbi:MAG TPA: transcription antitermination factor NusB [Desulfobacterales bacterium]|nr:transcription antitermination factor NusB [Desulfobacterales bacterium]HIP38501.1 transcription antitermination factor NusB [Desulfocapsa sulfexigens]
MGIRRKSREAVLQFLFQDDFKGFEVGSETQLEQRFADFCSLYDVQRKARPYAVELLEGVYRERSEIDAAISSHASNWRLERIDVTDRNILRIAVYEMFHKSDVPPEVAINEAVEIAKRFCGDDSPSFVNGILDAIKVQATS